MNLPVRTWSRKLFEIEDKLFEFIFNLDLSGVVKGDQLLTQSSFKENATAYQAVWTANIRHLLSRFNREDLKQSTFLDIGCGRGKPSFFAAFYPFKSIEGVDFDPNLVAEADKNLRKLRFLAKSRIKFRTQDVAELILENRHYILFLFNPFDEKVLELFLQNNAEKLKKNNSFICYANHRHKDVLEQFNFHNYYSYPERNLSIWN